MGWGQEMNEWMNEWMFNDTPAQEFIGYWESNECYL